MFINVVSVTWHLQRSVSDSVLMIPDWRYASLLTDRHWRFIVVFFFTFLSSFSCRSSLLGSHQWCFSAIPHFNTTVILRYCFILLFRTEFSCRMIELGQYFDLPFFIEVFVVFFPIFHTSSLCCQDTKENTQILSTEKDRSHNYTSPQ